MDVLRIDLERARREAKALLARARAGDGEALTHIGAGDAPRLADAQRAIARELGARDWPALRALAEEAAGRRARAEAFVRAATGDRIERADALLAADPELPREVAAAALVLGEPAEVDPTVPLQPLGLLPLLYVTHSRYLGGPRTDALLAAAERLLDAGADPGATFDHPEWGPQSALYGAAGIAHEPRMTELLLARGASPDDGESLYHATEARDHACVRLLLAAGATVEGTNALAHALDREDPALVELLLDHGPAPGEPWPERDRAIAWAIFRDRSALVVRLLAERGASVVHRDRRSGRLPYATAVARGRSDVAEVLAAHGARREASPLDELLGACLRGDRATVLRAGVPTTAAREALGAALVLAAGEGRVEATALLLDAGAPIEARGDLGGTALHHAAWNGRGGTVDLLLRRGADPLALAPAPAAGTPLHWAAHGSRNASPNGGAYLGIGRRLVAAGAAASPELAEEAIGPLAAFLAGRPPEQAPPPVPGGPDWGAESARLDAARLRALAASPAAAVRAVGDGVAVRTGVLDNTLNGVVCDACSAGEQAEAIAWLAGVPAQWLVGPRSSLVPGAPDDGAVVMGAAAADAARGDAPAGVAITEVAGEADVDAWLDLQALEGPRDRTARRPVLVALPPGFRLLLARDGGEPVGAIATFRDGTALLVEHLDVAEAAQRRGVGRALVTAALAAEPGVRTVIACPTPASEGFWERIGLTLQPVTPGRAFHLPAVPA